MTGKSFELNETTLPVIEELGRHMPGGFFIYRAEAPEELLYANKACFDIFGCNGPEDFKALTGYTFKGLVYPEDYEAISSSISEQIDKNEDNMDYVEYRIRRKDGQLRWVDDYGHYTVTEQYGGVYYVFISDITEKRAKTEKDLETRSAVISTLTNAYNTVWLINDVETETCSLFHTDMDAIHAEAIRNALSHAKYTDTKTQYVATMVAAEDQERMQEQISLPYILKQFEKRDSFSINFIRTLESGPKHYRIDFGKVYMPGGRIGVTMGFKDVDTEIREGRAVQKALLEAKKTEEENRRLAQEVESFAKMGEFMASISSLLTNMPAMSFSKDAESRVYLACNQAFAEYAGKAKPEEVVGHTDHELFDKVTADHFVEDDSKALAMDEAYIFFEDVPDATGQQFRNLQTTKTKFHDPSGRLCLMGLCVDVTEVTRLKTAEAAAVAKQQELEEKLTLQEQLLEQEKRRKEQDAMITAMASDYRSVYHVDLDADDAVCYRADPGDPAQTPEGIHFPFHARFREYGELYVDEEYLEDYYDFVDPDNIRKALATENIIAFRYRCCHHGVEHYEMLRMAGVRHPADRDDHVVHAIGVGFTIIDAEMQETLARAKALREALDAAEQANKAKTAFLSNMSHEIRTPMNAIIGLNNIALNEPDVPERVAEHLRKMGASAQHLLSIINDILDMSRIESGRMVIKNEEFSFAKGLEQVNTMVSGQCRDKGLTYECRTVGKIDDYYIGDAMKLKQVIINILGNAVKFTPEGGKITCLIEEGPRFDGMATLKFTISDTGIGMSKEYLPHLFETFSQEDASSTNKYGSTGLGMPITKSLVELMNGHVEVESEKGVGTTFTVTVTLGESDRKDGSVGESDLQPHEMSVLVIDDDPIALEHAQIILGQVGVHCETASSGTEGLEMVRVRHARRDNYDLVLVDWRMPEMDGLEAARTIRAMGRADAKTIPIIALTANAFDEDVQRSMQAGLDAHLSKPVEPEALFDTLESLIQA